MGSSFSTCANLFDSVPKQLRDICATLFVVPIVTNIGDVISKSFSYVISCYDGMMYYSIEFDISDNKNFQLKDTIFREIRNRNLHLTDHLTISDGYVGLPPNIEISNGTYIFRDILFADHKLGKMYVIISNDKIVLQISKGLCNILSNVMRQSIIIEPSGQSGQSYNIWENIIGLMHDYLPNSLINMFNIRPSNGELIANFSSKQNMFKKYVDETYLKHNQPDSHMLFFVTDNNNWKHAATRHVNIIDNPIYTNGMNAVLKNVDKFLSAETANAYAAKNVPYRQGYLLYGMHGSGKSALINIIATVHGMGIYMVQLNSQNMTDAILSELLIKVPPKSLIVFDEIDKQYDTITKNQNINISIGGIFSAIDGPARLSYGTIVIFTSNKRDCIPAEHMPILLRNGRIDYEFHLAEPFNLFAE